MDTNTDDWEGEITNWGNYKITNLRYFRAVDKCTEWIRMIKENRKEIILMLYVYNIHIACIILLSGNMKSHRNIYKRKRLQNECLERERKWKRENKQLSN